MAREEPIGIAVREPQQIADALEGILTIFEGERSHEIWKRYLAVMLTAAMYADAHRDSTAAWNRFEIALEALDFATEEAKGKSDGAR